MKALLHHNLSAAMLARLRAALPEGMRLAVVPPAAPARLAAELADTEVLLHVLAPVTAAVFDMAPRLALVQKIGVGVNTIDLGAARARGVRVANMPGTNSQAVAELTLALLLAAMRQLLPLGAAIREGRGWQLPPDASDASMEIAGKTVGLVGYGEIPRRLAPVLRALGADVVCHSRSGQADGHARPLSLDELMITADILSLHVPLTDTTRHLIDAARIARMKPGVVIINTARGALIDEAALLLALRSGQVRAAGLDVFGEEPVAAGHPLLALPNVVATPHVAWLTPETLERSFAVIAENCRELRAGRPLRFEIDLGAQL